jgi:hypothetical protein
MKFINILALLSLIALISLCNANKEEAQPKVKKQLQIGIKKKVENCTKKSRKGDSLSM